MTSQYEYVVICISFRLTFDTHLFLAKHNVYLWYKKTGTAITTPLSQLSLLGQTKRVLKKCHVNLNCYCMLLGMQSVLSSWVTDWASNGIAAGFLWKQDLCNQAACVHACLPQPPSTQVSFNMVADFDQTWQRGEFTKTSPSYIFNENKWAGRWKKLFAIEKT